jgi:hypothetical protein
MVWYFFTNPLTLPTTARTRNTFLGVTIILHHSLLLTPRVVLMAMSVFFVGD